MKKEKRVVIGGTFDMLHRGHKALLRKAFKLVEEINPLLPPRSAREGEVTIGLTSNIMARKMKKRGVEEDKSSSFPTELLRSKSDGKEENAVLFAFAVAREGEEISSLLPPRFAREVEDFKHRKRELEDFIAKEFKVKPRIVKIEDKFGPTLKEDFDYIVVSPATYPTATLINKARQKRNKKPIKIVKIEFVLAQDGKPISTTRILKGEIDRNGKLLK